MKKHTLLKKRAKLVVKYTIRTLLDVLFIF